MKIAIITMHAARNYGAVLQTYALQHYLEQNNYETVIIDYKLKNQTKTGYLLNINKKFKSNVVLSVGYFIKTFPTKIRTTRLFTDFQNRCLKLSAPVKFSNGQVDNLPDADVYCAGSDQIWNPKANDGFNDMYFLKDFPGKKISYASSIGQHTLSGEEQKQLMALLGDFDALSVRELSSVPLLETIGQHPQCVLDPTLLMRESEWQAFATDDNYEEPYLLIYNFGNAKSILETASAIATQRSLRIRRITVGYEKYEKDDIVDRFVTPEKFVSLFLNASYVITNSFHGTVFSINFKKEFLAYPTTENNARFDSVFEMFDLRDRNLRYIDINSVNDLTDIDYDRVSKVLEERRIQSRRYLGDALSGRSQ